MLSSSASLVSPRFLSATNSTGYTGVTKNGNGYQARVKKQGSLVTLGTFKSPEEAAAAVATEKLFASAKEDKPLNPSPRTGVKRKGLAQEAAGIDSKKLVCQVPEEEVTLPNYALSICGSAFGPINQPGTGDPRPRLMTPVQQNGLLRNGYGQPIVVPVRALCAADYIDGLVIVRAAPM